MKPIELKEIIDSMDMKPDEANQYFHRESGKIILVCDDQVLASDEDLEKYPEWKADDIDEMGELKDKVNEDDNYVELPTKYDIHEYSIMEDFCNSIEDENLQEKFFIAINGKGAFRRFKDTAYRYDLLDKWYEFKNKALKQIAIEWCKENNIEFVDK